MLGPSVSLYSGSHPLSPHTRDGLHGPENGAPITIGADCWIGGNVTICAGVSVGDGTTIGAGSVVTRSVEAGVLACGNPARVVRRIDGLDGEVGRSRIERENGGVGEAEVEVEGDREKNARDRL